MPQRQFGIIVNQTLGPLEWISESHLQQDPACLRAQGAIPLGNEKHLVGGRV
jgi:hypothetical protein